MKLCCRCKISKNFDQFYKVSDTSDGYASSCKECRKQYVKTYRTNLSKLVERTCTKCKVIKISSDFDNGQLYCKVCIKEYKQMRYDTGNGKERGRYHYFSRYTRVPSWLTKTHKQEIQSIYTKAQLLTKHTGIRHDVDHIVPLRGKTVSGLHVPWNLQILTVKENKIKGNKFNADIFTIS